MALYSKFKTTINGSTYIVSLPSSVYSGASPSFLSALGFTAVSGGADTADAINSFNISEGLGNGSLVRMRVSYKPAIGGKSRTSRVVCAVDKVATAKSDLLNEPFKGGTITSAGFPRRSRLR